MKIIKANAGYINTKNLTPYQMMEAAGRTCYKSENAITEDSAAKFVRKLAENKHTAMLEHAHIYMIEDKVGCEVMLESLSKEASSMTQSLVAPFMRITQTNEIYPWAYPYKMSIISGSFRTFLNMAEDENSIVCEAMGGIKSALNRKYPDVFTKPDPNFDGEDYHILDRNEFIDFIIEHFKGEERDAIFRKHLTHTVVFTCDRGVSHEFVRHRPCSFAQESTRYCNYSKDKFGNEITVIEPCYWSDHDSPQYKLWKSACENAESSYFELLSVGATAQEARSVLPNSLKTELVMTATEDEWQHIANLRYHGTTGAPHPQMKEVMGIAMPLLTEASDGRIS